MKGSLEFINKFNGAILSRYNSQEHIGLCLFTITDPIKEQIKMMMDLSILSSDFINNFICVESRLIDDFKCVLFVPTLAPDYLSEDKEFLDSFSNNVNIWAVNGFEPEKYSKEHIVPVEAIYLRASFDFFMLCILPLDSTVLSGQVFSASISHSAIGL